MIKPIIYIILIMVCCFYRCGRDESTLLSGDVVGYINMYDENHYSLSDKSGVNVTLVDDSIFWQTTSDIDGSFTFENIVFGNYRINLEKEGYAKSYADYRVHHLGGYSPTLLGYTMHKVPEYRLVVDSVMYDPDNWILRISGKISGNKGEPLYIWYNIRCFFHDSPSVSKDHFVGSERGIIEITDADSSLISGIITIYGDLWSMQSDSVYMCAYPEAYGQSFTEFYYESLGEPSNVIGFIFE